MNKFLKSLIVLMLALLVGLTAVACAEEGGKTEGKKGLLYKKINGVYTIYDYVDEGEGKTELNIADYLEEGVDNVRIQTQVFNGNETIKKVIVPSTVTQIDKGAFAGMKALEELTIPFVGMTSYADVKVGVTADDPEDEIVKSVDSERTIAHLFGDGEYTEAAAIAVNYGTGSNQSVTCYVPITLEKITIKAEGEYKIPACAFNGFNMPVEIAIEGNVTEIGAYAFAGATQINAIKLPATITKIHEGAFSGASNLKNINFNELTALTEISEKAFANTGLVDVVIPANVQKIGNEAFKDCAKLVSVKLSDKTTSIGNFAFYNSVKLEKVYTDGITDLTIGNYAFADCNRLTYVGAEANFAGDTLYVNGFTVGVNAFETDKDYQIK